MKRILAINKISLLVKFFLTMVFVFSALGKIMDPGDSVLSFIQLFSLPQQWAMVSVFTLVVLEVGIAIIIWWRVPSFLLIVPIAFWCVFLLSLLKGMNCGCFGSLPLLSEISVGGHFLLIIGIFMGLFFLTAVNRMSDDSNINNQGTWPSPKNLKWLGSGAILLMLGTFLPLPLPDSIQSAELSSRNNSVEYAFVKAAMTYPKTIIVDARPSMEYRFGHIKGAINIPYNSMDINALINQYVIKEKSLIVYCSSSSCNYAHILAKKLIQHGCKNVKVYVGGWEEWRQLNGNKLLHAHEHH